MDESRLAELLKDAVSDAPPPTFDQRDVAAESERQRVRHRNGVLAGSAFGVALLAGATALGVALLTGPSLGGEATSADSAASPGNGNAAPYEVPNEDNTLAPQTERGEQEDFPSETPKQGGSPDGDAGPAGPGGTPSGCEQADRELAAALAGELPAAAEVRYAEAQPVQLSCPHGSRGAAYLLSDGDRAGQLSVILVQPDITPPHWTLRDGSVRAQATAEDGSAVIVVSEPGVDGGSPPYGSDVQRIAVELGKRF